MLNVKPFKSSPMHCGPGVFKMVLGYYGIEREEKQLARQLGWTKIGGVTAQQFVKSAKKYGLKGFIKDNASLKDIRNYVLKKKIPIIVEWFLEDEGHFSVVVGIDSKNIYLMDPFIGAMRTLKLFDAEKICFMRVWFSLEGIYLKNKKDLILRRMIVLQKK